MTPEDFIAKWRGVELPEISASQSHFNDLCELLEIGKPIDVDPTGKSFTFEKAVPKGGKVGGGGHADVWRKDCFVWEYKRKNTYNTLAAAIAQARDYAALLDNPPLVVACDIDEIQIRTLFTGSVSVTHTIRLLDLNDVAKRQLLRQCFLEPQKLRPDLTPQAVTEEAARKFATLAQGLRERRDSHNRLHSPRQVAHFLNKIVFCLFAEDAGLLPGNVFSAIVEEALRDKSGLSQMLGELFDKMRTGKGYFGTVRIPWFNGGLFNDDEVLELLFPEVQTLGEAMKLDWASIEPVIFGTLFERGLDPARRKEMAGLFDAAEAKPKGRKKKVDAVAPPALPLRGGATATQRSLGKGVGIHYTDTATIMKIVEPVVLRPLAAEWQAVKAAIAKAKGTKKKDDLYLTFRERLGTFRVLDPACGSGNFLYLALRHLKDFDHKVEEDGRALGVTADPKGQRITAKTVLGIEINPYAAELARVTVWIGELQWQLRNGYGVTRRPILGALDSIENRDALLNDDGSEAKWPKASVIIGNPPFLGSQMMIGQLGEEYVEKLRARYVGRLLGTSDFVAFWVVKAAESIATGEVECVGLVTTNSIRGGANRTSLDYVNKIGRIFEAWSDEAWSIDGAAVRVSLVCFEAAKTTSVRSRLDGIEVDEIRSSLTADKYDFGLVKRLKANRGICFQGLAKVGPFDVVGSQARTWLSAPANPNGMPNSDVVRRWINGIDVTRRDTDSWIVDFAEMPESNAALYELPFEYVRTHVKPIRDVNRRQRRKERWWQHGETIPGFRRAAERIQRYIVTPRVAKHRVFIWTSTRVLPDSAVVATMRDDTVAFGILHSCVHEFWTLRLCTWLGVGNDPRYTPSTTFETFPFPEGLTPDIAANQYASDPRAKHIADAASKLNELRENWLNPSDLVIREPEVMPGYPERILPKNHAAAEQLKKRTLTNLYNQRPTWLAHAHRALDRAVAAAYGWPEALADRAQPENPDAADRKAAEEEILKRLFDLNQERAKAGR
ncbi:MAG: class I SAM-dependent DNA methyltransferase [Rhodospirillales bacterium]|nr:class I SAM-dependent DNA methyltransferase [Rhodospirillales bacterium]